jgi:hypothetical protein
MRGYYTGIGSRRTPSDVCDVIHEVASKLARGDWVCRTGGADGADMAFSEGVLYGLDGGYQGLDVYLPWPDFNGWSDRDHGVMRSEPQAEAFEIAARHHPVWDRLGPADRALHARNVHEVLGYDVMQPDPSKFLICWTPGASGAGGTGQALRIAIAYQVPIFDLARGSNRARLEHWAGRV